MKKKIVICIGIIVLIIACFFVDLLVIGEPVDGKQLICTTTVNGSTLELRISAVESAVALRNLKTTQNGTVLSISVRKVLVSPLFPSGSLQTTIPLDGITEVYLGSRIIWENQSKCK